MITYGKLTLELLDMGILSYAQSDLCKRGFSSGYFPGEYYAYPDELPNNDIKYGTWEITKRTNNTITVKVFSPYKSTMWINSYVNTAGWDGWQQVVTNNDLFLSQKSFPNGNTINDILAYANSKVEKSGSDITYISTGNLGSDTLSTMLSYTQGLIFHSNDVVNIVIWSYLYQTMVTNTRSRAGEWKGWKKFEGVAL